MIARCSFTVSGFDNIISGLRLVDVYHGALRLYFIHHGMVNSEYVYAVDIGFGTNGSGGACRATDHHRSTVRQLIQLYDGEGSYRRRYSPSDSSQEGTFLN